MRVTLEPTMSAWLDELAGVPPRQVLRFSKAEQATLRKAANIADAARELWRASVDYDTEGEFLDTELALIGVHVDEIVDGIEISP